MYTSHFGFKMLPFENVPDPVFFFEEGDLARIHVRITESLKAGRGLIVVTGPIGSGKTTLSQIVKSDFSHDIKQIWMAEPPLSSTDLFLFISQELGLKPESSERVFVLRDIKDSLLKLNSEGNRCMIIIDESHLMTDDVIDGIRMLNNLEEGSSKLVQILLLGQEEFMEKINRPELEPFKQRIATMEILGKMTNDRIRHYIAHRIQVAGGQPSLFADEGMEAVILAFPSGGTPRVINSLCDKSFTTAYEHGKTMVDIDDVYKAAEGMGLQKDIFFYKISLKKKERGVSAPSVDKDAVKENDKHEKVHADSLRKESDETGIKHEAVQQKPPQPVQEVAVTGFSLPGIDEKSLKIPVLVLVISIIVFILSIYYYCKRSDSSDLITCLLDLISF